jgi:adenine/guanine phosphoribosyltransferase-like PRPP-binding protein
VLLIDDVVTTGAQAGDGTRALLAAGAADVRIACVARTIDPHEHSRLTVRSHWPPRRAAAGHPHTIRAWPIESSSKWSP